jgi:hypothetical protein
LTSWPSERGRERRLEAVRGGVGRGERRERRRLGVREPSKLWRELRVLARVVAARAARAHAVVALTRVGGGHGNRRGHTANPALGGVGRRPERRALVKVVLLLLLRRKVLEVTELLDHVGWAVGRLVTTTPNQAGRLLLVRRSRGRTSVAVVPVALRRRGVGVVGHTGGLRREGGAELVGVVLWGEGGRVERVRGVGSNCVVEELCVVGRKGGRARRSVHVVGRRVASASCASRAGVVVHTEVGEMSGKVSLGSGGRGCPSVGAARHCSVE